MPADADSQDHRRWLRAALDGDAEAFGALVLAFAPSVRRSLRRFLTEEAEIEDVLQETFVRAHEALGRYDPTRDFGAWLRSIAVHRAVDLLRRRRPRADESLLERLPQPARAHADLEARQQLQIVDEEIRRLPAQWQAILRLRVHDEASYAEIATTLDIPIGTVMSGLSRARARLAARLAAALGEIPDARAEQNDEEERP